MMNVLNTLDEGLVFRTIEKIKRQKKQTEIKETPIKITSFFKS